MASAGLTVGGFYAHFNSKESLVAETIHSLLGQRRARVAAIRARTWRRRVRAMLHGYINAAHRDGPTSGCPVPAIVGDIARDGTARDALASELDALVRVLAAPGDGPQARRLAIGALSLQAGAIVLARALHETPLSDEVLDAALAFGDAAL